MGNRGSRMEGGSQSQGGNWLSNGLMMMNGVNPHDYYRSPMPAGNSGIVPPGIAGKNPGFVNDSGMAPPMGMMPQPAFGGKDMRQVNPGPPPGMIGMGPGMPMQPPVQPPMMPQQPQGMVPQIGLRGAYPRMAGSAY